MTVPDITKPWSNDKKIVDLHNSLHRFALKNYPLPEVT